MSQGKSLPTKWERQVNEVNDSLSQAEAAPGASD